MPILPPEIIHLVLDHIDEWEAQDRRQALARFSRVSKGWNNASRLLWRSIDLATDGDVANCIGSRLWSRNCTLIERVRIFASPNKKLPSSRSILFFLSRLLRKLDAFEVLASDFCLDLNVLYSPALSSLKTLTLHGHSYMFQFDPDDLNPLPCRSSLDELSLSSAFPATVIETLFGQRELTLRDLAFSYTLKSTPHDIPETLVSVTPKVHALTINFEKVKDPAIVTGTLQLLAKMRELRKIVVVGLDQEKKEEVMEQGKEYAGLGLRILCI